MSTSILQAQNFVDSTDNYKRKIENPVLSSSNIQIPDVTCLQQCAYDLVENTALCAEGSEFCLVLAPECFAACELVAVGVAVSCAFNCNGQGIEYLPTPEIGVAPYNPGDILTVSVGRKTEKDFLLEQGSVKNTTFYLMDLDSIPSDSLLRNTPFEKLPWIGIGEGRFDGNKFWNIKIDTRKYFSKRGFIIRFDFDDTAYVKLSGFGVAILNKNSPLRTPRAISLQGVLIDQANNQPFPDGKYPLKLTIYDSANAIYTQSFSGDSSIQVTNGVFNTVIGSLPYSVLFDKDYQLGISVNNQPEMMPRTAFTSVPYAMNAQVAERVMPTAAVTGLNTLTGEVQIKGSGNISVVTSDSTKTITISGSGSGGSGIQQITSSSGQIEIGNPTGPNVNLSIAPNAIDSSRIRNGSVTGADILANSITSSNLARDAVGTKISATIDFDSLAAGGMIDKTIPVSGAQLGGLVVLGLPNTAMYQGAAVLDISYTAWVSSAGIVTVRCKNHSSGSVNPDAGVFRVMVIPFP